MNLKVGLMLFLYYGVFTLIFFLGGSIFSSSDGYTSNVNINDTEISSSEIDTGGFFDTGVSFTRFFTLITFGIGLPEDTPTAFVVVFATWQIIINILAVMWIFSSIWDG